ncbi:nucleotidyltransferase family protein [Hymenobacter elongatus]|uniref:Nucleotidyltransferase family protein n=1 Tax=Hymenobacter elongatus TaxID=877208 RepID=A0A4Z0PPB7_9BACT|nr:nucleotidyltransferase family protein [Hymenobacter elongatus]TGE18325.1 nucleotidyltransferase family protein [Hymenobacter elongatus]
MLTAILLLAAGSSSRLGQPKQLLHYQGQTLLRRAATTAIAAAGGPVIVVTGALHEELLPELAGLPLTVVRCPEWEQGMGASLKSGLAALEKNVTSDSIAGITVMLCDQPLVTPALLRQLSATHSATGQPIVASEYGGVRGVPVFFASRMVPLLLHMPHAAGAAQLLKQHPAWVATVAFPGGATDVDTPAQYEALLAQEPPRHSATSAANR